MNTNLLFEEIKRLHEIMGVSPKNVILESIGQPWFESLMKDIIESATRNMDGVSDDIMDEAAYDAVRPWITKEFNLSSASPQDIDSYLRTINDELISGESLSNIGGGVNWYSLLDDVIKRNDSFYSKLVDDMITSGEFKEVSQLLSSVQGFKNIDSVKNPKLYNQQIDNLTELRNAINSSTMDDELKKIITNKLNLSSIPKKSVQPEIDTAFSELSRKIKGKNIKYDELVGLYDSAVSNPKLWSPENITNQLNTIKNSISESNPYFDVIPNVQTMVTKSANRFKLYERLLKLYKGQPSKSVFVIAAYSIFIIKMCLIVKVVKVLWDYAVKSGADFEIYKTMYGELSSQIKDLGGCITLPINGVMELLDGAQFVSQLTPQDEEVKAKLQEMLNNDQNNSDYIKFANELIKQGATIKDFEEAGLPTSELNFGGESQSGEETEDQILSKWKSYELTPGNKVGENGVKKKDGLYYASENSTVGYEYDKKTKTFK